MRVVLSHSSGVPLYEQIVEQIRQEILAGELASGAALPSLRALARDLRVSLITTTRAYNELAAEGLIVNVPGKGSFVADVDPRSAKAEALLRARADAGQMIGRAKAGGLISLEELQSILAEEWEK